MTKNNFNLPYKSKYIAINMKIQVYFELRSSLLWTFQNGSHTFHTFEYPQLSKFGTLPMPFVHRWPFSHWPHPLRSEHFWEYSDKWNQFDLSTTNSMGIDWRQSIFLVAMESKRSYWPHSSIDYPWSKERRT